MPADPLMFCLDAFDAAASGDVEYLRKYLADGNSPDAVVQKMLRSWADPRLIAILRKAASERDDASS